uniref:Uncharacterized protein n=1 Tax=Rhizophora mucronata TaxID=61149 RepID=A0A2P2QDZ7_RHIMU
MHCYSWFSELSITPIPISSWYHPPFVMTSDSILLESSWICDMKINVIRL